MSNIAILGHPTRGKEVIQLLEMFGGKSNGNIKGYNDDLYYYIAKDGLIYGSGIEYEDLCCKYTLFTLEEFLEKFPYKVDDVVVNHKYGKGLIIRMLWIDNEIVYEIEFEDYMAYCKANELCKYDAFKGLLLQELTEYLSHATREELDKTMDEIEISLAPFKVGDKVIVKGYEKMGEDEVIHVFKTYDGDIKYKTKNHLDTHYFMEDSLTKVEKSNKEENMEKRLEPVYELGTDKILYYEEKVSGEKYCPIGETTLYIQEGYEFRDETNNVINAKKNTLTRKQPQYPKDYEECCDVLGYSGNYNMILTTDIDCKLFNALYRLKVCRDAYWEIAGEQLGLDKPWEPDFTNTDNCYFAIKTCKGKISLISTLYIEDCILAFPTEEMRNDFFENFKELINDCKELL